MLMRRVAGWRAILCALAAVSASVATAEAPAVRNLLYVGNSFYYYNNSLHGHVNRLLTGVLPRAERSRYQSYSVTISGGHLKWHDVGAYLDAGIGSSAFNENNEVVTAAEPFRFDAVMMMDCSRCPYDEATRPVFHQYVKKHAATIRDKGATPFLFMTWAYADKPEMIDVLAREYVQAGKDNAIAVVPVGLAFAKALEQRPDIRLHVADRRHPSLEGTYLAACTVLASVYGRNPTGNSYTAGLTPEIAAYLQQIAWETVRAFP